MIARWQAEAEAKDRATRQLGHAFFGLSFYRQGQYKLPEFPYNGNPFRPAGTAFQAPGKFWVKET
ncbi:hypothetical protein RV134_280044 [Roseovarius sp. EC-HK134]|nr:hypothetical protein RV134_280044 [Roseovarius sp. EC-HK134]